MSLRRILIRAFWLLSPLFVFLSVFGGQEGIIVSILFLGTLQWLIFGLRTANELSRQGMVDRYRFHWWLSLIIWPIAYGIARCSSRKIPLF